MLTSTPCFCSSRAIRASRSSNVPWPPLSTRYASCISRGPSRLRPTRNRCFLKERAPLVVEPGAVGLNRVGDRLSGSSIRSHELDGTREEVETHQRRLASLPRDRDLGPCLRLEQLPDVDLEQLVGHPETAAGIEHLLRQEEAVLAVQVADGAGRFRQQMELRGPLRRGHCRAIATRNASSGETMCVLASAASAIAICTPLTRPVNSLPRGP